MIGNIIFTIAVFIITFGVFYFNYCQKLKRKDYQKLTELNFFIKKYNLNKKILNYQRVLFVTAIINASIISFVATLIYFLPINYAFRFLIAFVLLIALIYSLYEIYGRYLERKWGKNNEL